MKYRAEIDGLRAFAVLPVILFHAGFNLFSGGFVGVDVFFVISGYLITTILIEENENNKFSLIKFYERRARRILPALFFMILVCIPFSWLWMLPSQAKDFSQSVVAVILFASNILFWMESGYFDESSEEKPLLHTWSLAVEEQYYILFPVFLFLAWRHSKGKIFWLMFALSVISLSLSEWGWRNNATANFYLAPSRAWELLAGSMAAFIVRKRGVRSNESLSIIGFLAILFSIVVYDEDTPFPSLYSLVPVVGVVLVVLFADKKTCVAKILSNRVFVSVGLISYSAYLWHQPFFAFARIKSIEEPGYIVFSCLIFATFLMAYLSWKYVEQPFRNKLRFSAKYIFSFSAFSSVLFIVIGSIGYVTNGFEKYRFSEEQLSVFNTALSSPLRSKCHFPQTEDD